MDVRLWSVNGMRPESLKRSDLPNVARAIVGYHRGFCKIRNGFERNVSFLLFLAPGFQILVRGDDWGKIIPFIRDGTLAPPPEVFGTLAGDVSMANIDIKDPIYYARVLGVLQGIFTQDYPTSKL